MLDRLSIPNFKVTSEEHVWNVIYYNGKWTHIDATWDDDEINKNTVFMRGEVDAIDYKYYTEPNIPPIKLSDE